MILFIGQVASDQRDREAFQELDYRQMFGPGTLGLAKWVGEVQDADRLPEYVARAFHTALQGRPGPVVLVLPEDMLTTLTTAPVLPRAEPALAWPAPDALLKVRSMLLAAQRPFVIVGGSGCQSVVPFVSRICSTTTTPSTQATWASASIPGWQHASRRPTWCWPSARVWVK